MALYSKQYEFQKNNVLIFQLARVFFVVKVILLEKYDGDIY